MTDRSAMFMESDATAVSENPSSTCETPNASCICGAARVAFSPMVPETGHSNSKKQHPTDSPTTNCPRQSIQSGHAASSCPAETGRLPRTSEEAGASGGFVYEEDPNEVFTLNAEDIRHSVSSDSSLDSLSIDPGKHVVFMFGKRNYFVINEEHVGKRRVTLIPVRKPAESSEEETGGTSAKVDCGDNYTQTRRGHWIELDESIYNTTGEHAAKMRRQNVNTDGPGPSATGASSTPIVAGGGFRGQRAMQPPITAHPYPIDIRMYPESVPYYAVDEAPITAVHSLPRGFVAGPQLSPTRIMPGCHTPPRATSSPCLSGPQDRCHRRGNHNNQHVTASKRLPLRQDAEGCLSCQTLSHASGTLPNARQQRGCTSSSSLSSETSRGASGGQATGSYTSLRLSQQNDNMNNKPAKYYRGDSDESYMDMSGVAPADFRNEDARMAPPAPRPGPPQGEVRASHPASPPRYLPVQALPGHILQEARQMPCYQRHMSVKHRERRLLFDNVAEEYKRNDGSYFMWRSDEDHLVVSTMYSGSLRHMRLFFSGGELWVEGANIHAHSLKDLLAACTGIPLPLTINIENVLLVSDMINAPPVPPRPRGSFCGLTEAIKFLPPIKRIRTVSQGTAESRAPAPSPVRTRNTAVQRSSPRSVPSPNGSSSANTSSGSTGSFHTPERQMPFG